MAQIYSGTFTIGYMDDSKTEGVDEFFEIFENVLSDQNIEYEKTYAESDKTTRFHFFNKATSFIFYQFGGVQSESDRRPRIDLGKVNGEYSEVLYALDDITVDHIVLYEIIVSSYGDIMLRMKDSAAAIDNNNGIVFVICRCNNTVEASKSGYGIYIPWQKPNEQIVNSQNCTPKMLLTSDSSYPNIVSNTGTSGSTASTTLSYIINANARISILVPICAVSSQCVSINTKIMAIAPAPITGYAVLNGQRYYCVGQVCMADDEE